MLSLQKYFVGSLIAHVCMLLLVGLFSTSTLHIKETFIVFGAHSKKPVPVSYKSLKGIVPFVAPKKDTAPAPNKKAVTKNNLPAKTQAAKKLPVQKKSSPVNQKNTGKAKTPPVEKKQTSTAKTTSKNKPPIKNSPVVEPKQKLVKKPAVKKPCSPPKQKAESTKEVPKPQPVQNTLEKKDPNSSEQKQPVQQHKAQDSAPCTPPEAAEQIVCDEIDLGSVGASDDNVAEMSEYQKVIHQEATRVWRPPLGVPQGTTSLVTFTIAPDGTHESELTQGSPVIIYNLSVMRAARSMKFPKSWWGKKFKIAFRQ